MTAQPPVAWILLDRDAGHLERQIHDAIRDRIVTGQLKAGERLPSTRSLAAALGVARSTVVGGYELLRAEGFIAGRQGSAMRVADLPAALHGASARPVEPLPKEQPEPERSLPFRPGLPDLDSFPNKVWSRCLSARARHLRIHDLGYGDENGLAELRKAIAEHVVRARAVMAGPEQVVIMPSTAAILGLLAKIIHTGAGRPVWLEEPGYSTARDTFRGIGATLVSRPCDAEGMTIGYDEGSPPSMIHVTPSHQYPTGVAMSLPRRMELLKFAAANRSLIIEDDYDSEFHYASRPLAALQGIDRSGCVIYIGTFSKVLAPGLRVAYAILPPSLLTSARSILRQERGSVPIHVQAALADFLNAGHLRSHIRRMHDIYQGRMQAVRTTLLDVAGEIFDVGSGSGGLQIAAWFRNRNVDDMDAARRLHTLKIGARALSPFHMKEPRPGLLFGIASATDDQVARLAKAMQIFSDGRH